MRFGRQVRWKGGAVLAVAAMTTLAGAQQHSAGGTASGRAACAKRPERAHSADAAAAEQHHAGRLCLAGRTRYARRSRPG